MPKPPRGVYERRKGSGIWWIRYWDVEGKKHCEKAGALGAAKKLLEKRHTTVLKGEKLPEHGRGRVRFSSLCDDALTHSRAENSPKQTYELETRIRMLRAGFGSRPAETIRKNEIQDWLVRVSEERKWSPATRNRWQATFSLVFRVGIDNERIAKNPAGHIRRKTENNGRVRFLSDEEEVALTAAIRQRFPEFLPHLLLSIHTGMRMTEQYSLRWSQVDFPMRLLYLPKTKNGDPRAIPLNDIAIAALEQLRGVGSGRPSDPVFLSLKRDYAQALQGSRGWFPTAVELAGLRDYTWHCNRRTFASRLVMVGVDLLTVAHLLGHRTLQMVMRYAHLAPRHQADAVARLVSGKQSDTPTDTDGFGRKSGQKVKRVSRSKMVG